MMSLRVVPCSSARRANAAAAFSDSVNDARMLRAFSCGFRPAPLRLPPHFVFAVSSIFCNFVMKNQTEVGSGKFPLPSPLWN